MADEPELDPVDEEQVDWQVDDDGTEFFLDEDGVRWELGDDGYAYAVEEVPVPDAEAGAAPNGAASAPSAGDADPTTVIPTVQDDGPPPPSAAPEATITRAPRSQPTARPSAGDGGDLLRLDDVHSGYGKLPVLHGVGFGIRPGETAVLFGLNGAGKTTTAMNVCGAVDTWSGRISFADQDVTRWTTRQAVANGIVMVPEGRRVFPELSVERNLQVGAWSQRSDSGWFEQQRDRVYEYFPRLGERTHQLAGTLSGGEQQMLAIGRGLMANPRLLIIDEASMGLAPVIVQDVFEIVSQINEDGVTVLMIEQNVGALDVADVALVMEQGHIIRELRGDELADRSLVSEILMG